MAKKQKKHVIADNDGTQVSFPNWFGPAMIEAVPVVATALGVPLLEAGTEIGRNMLRHRTHETAYPFGGSYFASKWKGTHGGFVEAVTEPFFRSVDFHRNKHLHKYVTVEETLDECRTLGVNVYVLSDAPLYATLHKFSCLGWHDKFAGIYAMESPEPPAEEIWNDADLAFCRAYVRKHMAASSKFTASRIVALPRHAEKPNTAGIDMVMSDFAIPAERAVVIGDSRQKDGGIAQSRNIDFVFARYGCNDCNPPQYMDVLNNLLNPNRGKPFSWHATEEEPPVHTVAGFYDALMPILRRGRRLRAA
jgi:FMN phosphatase YigB (HAD superfamily)